MNGNFSRVHSEMCPVAARPLYCAQGLGPAPEALHRRNRPHMETDALVLLSQNGGVGTVTLMRMANEEIADRRQLFETFTEMKNEAMVLSDKKLAGMTDKVVDLWSKMVGPLFALHCADLLVSAPALLDVVLGVGSPGPCRNGAWPED